MSTPVHPVATQLNKNDFEIATLEKHQLMLQSVRPSVGLSLCATSLDQNGAFKVMITVLHQCWKSNPLVSVAVPKVTQTNGAYRFVAIEATRCYVTRNVRRILVRGINAPLPIEAKKILKI